VGAGDSFTAGLIASLIRRGQYTPGSLARCPADQLGAALEDAILVASLNCERRGNDPPTMADLAVVAGHTR
jgi:fructokinase